MKRLTPLPLKMGETNWEIISFRVVCARGACGGRDGICMLLLLDPMMVPLRFARVLKVLRRVLRF